MVEANLSKQIREVSLIPEPTVRRQSFNPNSKKIETSIDITQYLKIILRHKYLIISCIIIVMTLTKIGLNHVHPLYEAIATIQIDPENVLVLSKQTLLYQNRVDPDYFNTQLRLLTGDILARQTVKKLNLNQNEDYTAGGPTTLKEVFFQIFSTKSKSQSEPKKNKNSQIPVSVETKNTPIDAQEAERLTPFSNQLLSTLEVSPIKSTRLVQVIYEHQNPKMAQTIVNSLVETFSRNNLEKRIGSSKSSSNFLQQRIAELQSEIHTSEEELVEYCKTHQIVSLEPDQNAVMERFTSLNKKLLEVEIERKEVESVRKIMHEDKTLDILPNTQELGGIQAKKEQLVALKQKRNELLTEYTEEWPEVKQLDEKIQQTQDDLSIEKERILNSMESRYRVAVEKERVFRGDLNKQLSETLKQNESAITYRIKQQEIEIKKELFKVILGQLKETDISASSEINNIFVANSASLPKMQVSPRVGTTLSYAFVLSLLGGIGLAFASEYFNNRIKSVEDVDKFINLPTFGLIPVFKPEVSFKSTLSNWFLETSSSESSLKSVENVELISLTSTKSSIAEAYRQLRTSILLSTSDRRNRVLLITGSQPAEGKTTTAINTAISLAQTGAQVVLLDCDLRKPRVHKVFNISVKNGLSTYLSGQCYIEDLSYDPAVPNLTVLPCGPLPPNPAELLGSKKMDKLIDYLAERYDYVIVDAPPILSFADSVIISSRVDSVLLVVNTINSRREVVQRACRILEEANANLIGIVLNSVNTQEYSYYGYNYGYKYYQDRNTDGTARTLFQRFLKTMGKYILNSKNKTDKKNVKDIFNKQSEKTDIISSQEIGKINSEEDSDIINKKAAK